jgi:hypothetical protein
MSLVCALTHGERAVAGRGCARESRKPPQSLICSLRTLTLLKTFLPKGVHITSYYNVIVFSCFFLPRMLRLIGNDRFFRATCTLACPSSNVGWRMSGGAVRCRTSAKSLRRTAGRVWRCLSQSRSAISGLAFCRGSDWLRRSLLRRLQSWRQRVFFSRCSN